MAGGKPNRLDDALAWLIESHEPWTRYRTLLDLLDRPEDAPEVQSARAEMVAHHQVQTLFDRATTWGDAPLTRHNDASHPIHALSTLTDFGVRASDLPFRDDNDLPQAIAAVLAHQSAQGAFQTVLRIPPRFGGTGQDTWAWLSCDAPVLLYALLAMGLGNEPQVSLAISHLESLIEQNGWRCVAAPELGRFRGPGRKTDPCPIANVYALKALACAPAHVDSPQTRVAAEMLLDHWNRRVGQKFYLFGIGTDFCRLKYPFVWYDILHVVDVLSRFPFVQADPRYREMVETIVAQATDDGRHIAGSMYRAWKDWSFADKKEPSPWLTFLVMRIRKRAN